MWVYFGSQQNLSFIGICDKSDLCAAACDSLTGHTVSLARVLVHCFCVCVCVCVCVCLFVCVCVCVDFFCLFNRLNPGG